jgi:hypothetical protein
VVVGLWVAGWTSSLGLAWPVIAMEALLLVGLVISGLRQADRPPDARPEKSALRVAR